MLAGELESERNRLEAHVTHAAACEWRAQDTLRQLVGVASELEVVQGSLARANEELADHKRRRRLWLTGRLDEELATLLPRLERDKTRLAEELSQERDRNGELAKCQLKGELSAKLFGLKAIARRLRGLNEAWYRGHLAVWASQAFVAAIVGREVAQSERDELEDAKIQAEVELEMALERAQGMEERATEELAEAREARAAAGAVVEEQQATFEAMAQDAKERSALEKEDILAQWAEAEEARIKQEQIARSRAEP